MIRTSIVIPLHGGVQLTKSCHLALRSSLLDRDDVEIVYVDNASPDGTRAWLETIADEATLVLLDANANFSGGCNAGVAASSGANVVLLNNDTEPTPGWLEVLEAALEEPTVGVVGCLLLYPGRTVQHCGVWLSNYPAHALQGEPRDDPRALTKRDMQAVTAACMGLRRDVWDELGGLDEAFVNGMEDVDLCLRARRLGYRVTYDPRAIVVHHEGMSIGRAAAAEGNLARFDALHATSYVPDDHVWEVATGIADLRVVAERAQSGDGVDNAQIVDALGEGRLELRAGGVTLAADGELVERIGGLDPSLERGDALLDWLDRCRLAGAHVVATGAFPPAMPWASSDVPALAKRWGQCAWHERERAVVVPFIDVVQDVEARIEVERQSRAVLLATTPDQLERCAREAFEHLAGTAAELTLLIRIEPDDHDSYAVLEAAADGIAEAAFPDVAIIEGSASMDLAIARACEAVLVVGSPAQQVVQRSIARAAGVPTRPTCAVDDQPLHPDRSALDRSSING